MAGGHRSMETGDRHRAPAFSYSPAGPRSSPPLTLTRSFISTSNELRSLQSTNDYENEYDDESEHYTLTSSKETWQTYSTHEDETEQRLRDLKIEDGPSRGLGIDPGMPDKEIPRSYAEAVKSFPKASASHPTCQLPSPRPSKQPINKSAKHQGQGHGVGCKKSTQSPQKVVDNAIGLAKRQNTGTDHTEVEKCNNLEGTNRSTARAKPTTIRRGYANRNHTFPTPIAHNKHADKSANAHAIKRANSVPCEEPTSFLLDNVSPGSWFLNTKGIGEWADEPSRWYDSPSLKADIPRIVSTNSPEYRKLITLDAVVRCATGNTGSNWPKQQFAPSSNSAAGRKAGSRRGGKGPAGNRGKGNGNGADGGGGDDGKKKTPQRKTKPRQSNQPERWYACHFYRHDPLYFCINGETRMKYKTCCAGKWTDICRLKEHLYRAHTDPPTCDRCQAQFSNGDQLTAHLRGQEFLQCPLRERSSRGIPPTVMTELRKRPRREMPNEDRWYNIWDLLFPNEERPSTPYSDLPGTSDIPTEFDTFDEYLEERMGGHFSAKFGSSLNGMNLTELQKEQLTELAVQQEREARLDLLGCYRSGQTPSTPSPGYLSENSVGRSLALDTIITNEPPLLGLECHDRTLGSQAWQDIRPKELNYQSAIQYANDFGTLHPTTPASSHQPRPSTPAQNSSSGKSAADSTYYSNRGSGSYSGVFDEADFVNPAVFAPYPNTPTPHMAPPQGANLSRNTSHSSGHSQHLAGLSPWSPGADDAMMGDGLSDHDAPYSPDYTSQVPSGPV